MTWYINEARVGWQAMDASSTVQNHPLGTVVQGTSPTYGGGEFVYLLGVGSTLVGSVVSYISSAWQTALAPVGTGLPRPLAIAMSANGAAAYGWYQISGIAIAKKAVGTSLAANAPIGINTIGLVSATASLTELGNALVVAVASAKSNVSTVQVMISRPFQQGSWV